MGLKGYPGTCQICSRQFPSRANALLGIGRNSMSSDGMGMGGDYSQPFLSGGESPGYKGRTSGSTGGYSSSSMSSDR